MNNSASSLQPEPVQRRKTLLPYGRQWIDESDMNVEQFERKLAKKVGASYAVAFSNGTEALHAAYYAAGIGPGDEVITTPITFDASANCMLYQQGILVFADIDGKTYNIDPNHVAALITPKTKAIIPVDFTGQPADLHKLITIAKQHGLVVIEDAVHALGATYDGQPIGSISDMTIFSFQVIQISSGEGGVITTNNAVYYNKLLEFRSHSFTDMQVALASSQLDKLDRFVELRGEYAARYDEAFSLIRFIKTPFQKELRQSSWYLYVIQLELEFLSADRNQIYDQLIAENIGVQLHYIPVYLHPYYQQLRYAKGQCLQAEKLFERMLVLPLFPSMTQADVQDVIDAVLRVIGKFAC
jgi:perosamine synthetase